MSQALNKAIGDRITGVEVLTGDQAEAQTYFAGRSVGYGTMRQAGVLPALRFYEDAGSDAMPHAPDVGIISNSIYRFESWTRDFAGDFFGKDAMYLELLFDERRGAPALTLEGQGRVFMSGLFVPMQAPLLDRNIDAHYGLMAFVFVESRP